MNVDKVKKLLVWAEEELNNIGSSSGRKNALLFLRLAVCEMSGCKPSKLYPIRCEFCGGGISETRQ